jgi:hypothetical protein
MLRVKSVRAAQSPKSRATTREEAVRPAHYLAAMVGKSHSRQANAKVRKSGLISNSAADMRSTKSGRAKSNADRLSHGIATTF